MGNDQLDSSYTAISNPFIVSGPSSWLGEMSSDGSVPSDSVAGPTKDYSF